MGNLCLFNLDYFIKKYNTQAFIETGLGGGGGLTYASRFPFQVLISTEIDATSSSKFISSPPAELLNRDRVKIINAPSDKALDAILPSFVNVDSVLFWLDAHFPGEAEGVAYDYEKDLDVRLPLEKELTIINKHRQDKNDILIIDDQRIYTQDKYQDGSLENMGLGHISKYKNNLDTLLGRFDVYKLNMETGYLICTPKKKRKFGIRMAGNEIDIENIFQNYLLNHGCKPFDEVPFNYLEIGAAGTVTMKSIYEIVKSYIKHDRWQIMGLDLPNGWSLDWSTINSFAHPLNIIKEDDKKSYIPNSHASLYLQSNPREWIAALPDESIDICFIDGCHGKRCVLEDFRAVESKIVKGGIIFFHDAGVPEQGTDWQGHCQENINVRQAIEELGLLNGTNKQWKFLFETNGSRKIGGDGNSCIFIEKL